MYEVQTWMGTPSFYVWDCSNAGIIIQNFLQFEEDRENETTATTTGTAAGTMGNITQNKTEINQENINR